MFFQKIIEFHETLRIGKFTEQTVAEIELALLVMIWTIQQWGLLKQAYWLYLHTVKSRWGRARYFVAVIISSGNSGVYAK